MLPKICEQRITWRTPLARSRLFELLRLLRDQEKSGDDDNDEWAWLLAVVEEQRAQKYLRPQLEGHPTQPGL